MKKVTTLVSAFILSLIGFNSIYAQEALIISEYLEGSSNNKAIELFNTTDSTIDLSSFRILRSNNGDAAWQDTLNLSGTLSSGDVYVIGNSQAVQEILDVSDTTHSLTFFNGDDAIGLQKNESETWTLIDVIGVLGVDPGSAWDVAGVTGATNEQTLVRKSSVLTGSTDWAASAGTNADDSQWTVYDQNDLSHLGLHNAVKVTFIVNTSTLPDTLAENNYIQLRGAVNGAGGDYLGQTIDWNTNSDLVADNVGGDYWKVNVVMLPKDTLIFKVWSGFDAATGTDNGDGGWETISANREFVSTPNDTTLTIYSDTETPPFISVEDSVTLYFRVNVGYHVQVGDFDPETDKVGLRGAPNVFQNPADWSSSAIYLDQEEGSSGDNLFYSGALKVDQVAADTLDTVPYKFVLEAGTTTLWDDVPGNADGNRFVNIPSQDSTVRWVNFQQKAPTQSEIINAKLTFSVDMGILEGLGYFNTGLDSVMLRGTFNGFGEEGMAFNGFTNTFEEVDFPVSTTVGTVIEYKYYVKWDETRFTETSDNYLPGIAQGAGWEEPGVTAGANRKYTVTDQTSQTLPEEYYNGVPPQGLITDSNIEGGGSTMDVTFQIDMTDALTYTDDAFKPESDSVFLFVDTPFFALSQGIIVPGDQGDNFYDNTKEQAGRLLFTDDDDDNIYTLTLTLETPTLNHIGYRIAYGTPFTTGDAAFTVNGLGASAEPGRRYYQYIQPVLNDDGTVSWPASATLSVMDWVVPGEPVAYENPPSYSGGLSNETVDKANTFSLSQNYPNPFNPTTTINFNLAKASQVNLVVFNVLGQEVAKLVSNQKMSSGLHSVSFNASELSSGIYFYRIEAGNYTQVRSMTLIK